MKVNRAISVNGRVNLPGDKSISHRSAMLAAIADGQTRIENFATSADCASTIECLRGIGVSIERVGNTVTVDGVGKNGFSKPSRPLDCGNSGTTMRLMSGLIASRPISARMVGDASLFSSWCEWNSNGL